MTKKINVAVIGLGVGFKHALIYKKNKYTLNISYENINQYYT